MESEENMPNPVVYFEILGSDYAGLQQYYRDLFGWKITQMSPEMDHSAVIVDEDGEGIPGGIGRSITGSSRLTFYVQVDDIQASLDRAGELGGETAAPVTVIPGMVTFAHFKDPEGNLVGLVSSEIPPRE